jgi:hypothetical protein
MYLLKYFFKHKLNNNINVLLNLDN